MCVCRATVFILSPSLLPTQSLVGGSPPTHDTSTDIAHRSPKPTHAHRSLRGRLTSRYTIL